MKTVLTLMLASVSALTGCSAGVSVGTTQGAALPVAGNSKGDSAVVNNNQPAKQQAAWLSSTEVASNQPER